MKTPLYEAPDISVHNGTVNFKALRDAGYPQVFLRAGYGKNNVDQKYVANAEACRNLGIPVMTYWFSYALTVEMAAAEAEYAVHQTGKYWAGCPIAFDLEYDTIRYAATKGVHIDKRLATRMAIAFLKKVQSERFVPVIYMNRDYQRNYFDMDEINRAVEGVQLWYARYSLTIPLPELEIARIWQYTSEGSIPGVNGNVDLNKVYANLSCTTVAAKPEHTCNLRIKEFQIAANADGYRDADGNKLAEDGIDGLKTQYVRRQIYLKARLLVFVGSRGAVVKWWQSRCNEILGHHQEVDGLYGKNARMETVALQDKLGLVKDGVAGYDSLQAAFYH